MDGLMPMPAASWLLDAALHHTEQARAACQHVETDRWQGNAAAAYRTRMLGLLWTINALHQDVSLAQRRAWSHEQDLRAVQAQYGDAR